MTKRRKTSVSPIAILLVSRSLAASRKFRLETCAYALLTQDLATFCIVQSGSSFRGKLVNIRSKSGVNKNQTSIDSDLPSALPTYPEILHPLH